MDWLEYVLSIFPGLAASLVAIITLTVKLIEYVQKAIKEKNWGEVLKLVMGYMEAAEEKFETGAEKKEWVLAMVKASADTVNYDIDMDVISKLIDDLCDMSNVVNPPAEKAGD